MFCLTNANAAHFEANHEMTYCNSDATISSDFMEPLSDRHDNWDANFNSAISDNEASDPNGTIASHSESYLEFEIDDSESGDHNAEVYMYIESSSNAMIDNEGGIEADAWTNAQTVSPGFATGNFYTIMPDEGEANGDWVEVSLTFNAEVSFESQGAALAEAMIQGPDDSPGHAGPILITKNCADLDDPQPEEIVYSISKKVEGGTYQETTTFLAQIGDVIGIHILSHARCTAQNNGDQGYADAEAEIALTITGSAIPPFEPSMADFDKNGIVDLADLAMFASAWLWQNTPDNDDCADAIEIELNQAISGTNENATGAPMDICSEGSDGKDVWYYFVNYDSSTVYVSVTLDLLDATLDTSLSIWTACDGYEIDCISNTDSYKGLYGIEVPPGEKIYIRVAGYSGSYPDEGSFDIMVTDAPM